MKYLTNNTTVVLLGSLLALAITFVFIAPAMNKDAAENKYPPVARDLMKAHDSVVERTQEVPDGTGNLRTSAFSIGTGANCITVIQLYQAKSSFYYLGHPVFRNEPDQIQMIPCSSPK